MKTDHFGVRVSPPLIAFKETRDNEQQRISLSVKNVSSTGKTVKIYAPQTEHFQFIVPSYEEKYIAPGLEVVATVIYAAPNALPYEDHVSVIIDRQQVIVPVKATPSRPDLVLEGPVYFGCIVANSRIFSQKVNVHNLGSQNGTFQIRYDGDQPISFIPSSGEVAAKSSTVVKVEFVARVPGVFDETASVILQDKPPALLRVSGQAVDGSLELLHLDTDEPVDCINFGPTYYGTDRTHAAVLYNNGPEPVNFVVVLDEGAVGQELGEIDSENVNSGRTNDFTSLVFAIPNQGKLAAFEKMVIFFKFSPKWCPGPRAFKTLERFPPRQDFSIFMNLKVVGASYGFQKAAQMENAERLSLEICLTGAAVPVMLTFSNTTYEFGDCAMGAHIDHMSVMRNCCPDLPINFKFRRTAHFNVRPFEGRILPDTSTEVVFTFNPKQAGFFNSLQFVDVTGLVSSPDNPFCNSEQVIYTAQVSMSGSSGQSTSIRPSVFNQGITPQVANEVGRYIATEPVLYSKQKPPHQALLRSIDTTVHSQKRSMDTAKDMIALPNDKAGSLRPTDPRFRTPFTKTSRHTYLDPDYAYTPVEMESIKRHRQHYIDYLNEMRETRRNRAWTAEYKKTNNPTDITLTPGGGLKPRKLKLQDMVEDTILKPDSTDSHYQLLSTKTLADAELLSSVQVVEGLNAQPITRKEISDCQRELSPKELHQVIIGPPTIHFGEVCLKSISEQKMYIINNLDHFVHVVMQLDCRELRHSSPLSQVVPPHSKAYLPIIFDSASKGNFQRSLKYTINKTYSSYVTVFAKVVSVHLELSCDRLKIEEHHGLPVESGLRGVVTLINKLNYRAEFTWIPIVGEKGTAFSIRPASGVVAAYSELDCEVVFHPSFLAPEEGFFTLQVVGGESHKLSVHATLGVPSVTFIDRRLTFGEVPLNLKTTRTATLSNNGSHHAYFQVLDTNPLPGLTVSPVYGVVPVGGTAEISLDLKPTTICKFDAKISIAIRGSRVMELRIGGSVEFPSISIDVASHGGGHLHSQFLIGGVCCTTSHSTPFKIVNKENTRAQLDFDLRKYPDFHIVFQSDNSEISRLKPKGVYCVEIDPEQVIDCELIFSPTEVASYDFMLPVTINETPEWMTFTLPDPPSRGPASRSPASRGASAIPSRSSAHPGFPRMPHEIPHRRVLATALPEPLQLSAQSVDFVVSPRERQMAVDTGGAHVQNLVLVNSSQSPLKWLVDLSEDNPVLQEGVFKFLRPSGTPFLSFGLSRGIEGTLDAGETATISVLFCPDKPGYYKISLPIILDDNHEQPYRHITLTGYLRSPILTFRPAAIFFTPLPLLTSTSVEFEIHAQCYRETNQLQVTLPEILLEDDTTACPLTLTFHQSKDVIEPSFDENGREQNVILKAKLTFSSSVPISFSEPIKFEDELGNSFLLQVTATAGNSLLTCYPFLAKNSTDHQIICQQRRKLKAKPACSGCSLRGRRTVSRESGTVGEAIMVNMNPIHDSSSRPSTTATASAFDISYSSSGKSSSPESTTTSSLSSGLSELSPLREGAINSTNQDKADLQAKTCIADCTLGSSLLIDDATDEGIFHMEVLMTVQRWFSLQGWPTGPYPIVIPNTLRCGLSRKPREMGVRSSKSRVNDANNVKKEFVTVYDMVAHMVGRPVPGIPINNPMPVEADELVKQIYWQHCTLLTFLKTQGACIASVKPEYLMEPEDYFHWRKMKRQLEEEKRKGSHMLEPPSGPPNTEIEAQLFEIISRRAWTDILLQLLKIVVLGRLFPRQLKMLPSPYPTASIPSVDPNPLCSNIYSVGERAILLWLNHNYEQQRRKIWKTSMNDETPASRWIVNFDFDLLDGLVLAAALAAYAPFLIKTHFQGMYTKPDTAEQCLHNALKVVNAMRYIHIDYDIQAIDITDPNPICMLLLCVHLYNNLPSYLPVETITFVGALHATISKQVRVFNPSSRHMSYHILLVGHDARDFYVAKGTSIQVSRKSRAIVPVEFTSRFLRPAEALLLLVGKRQGTVSGTTMVFKLQTQLSNIMRKVVIKCESPCYELETVPVEVKNPFNEGGDFRIVLAETKEGVLSPFQQEKPVAPSAGRKSKVKSIRSKTNNGQPKKLDQPRPPLVTLQESLEGSNPCDGTGLTVFSCRRQSVYLRPEDSATIYIDFLPFTLGTRHCSVIFINEQVGEFVYSLEGIGTTPLPQAVPFSAENQFRVRSPVLGDDGDSSLRNMVFWQCRPGDVVKESLHLPVNNMARDRAIIIAATQKMSDEELERRKKCGVVMSDSMIRSSMKRLGLLHDISSGEGKSFKISLDSNCFTAPANIYIPDPYRAMNAGLPKLGDQPRASDTVEVPMTFECNEPGQYMCTLTLSAGDDTRVYKLQCFVIPDGKYAEMEFTSPLHQSVVQEVPIVNTTNREWPMEALIEGSGFSGPFAIIALPMETTKYPLTFAPHLEGVSKGKLVLRNIVDQIDHVYHLIGNADKPLPQDTIYINCSVKERQSYKLSVPNYMRKKIVFDVSSSLAFISGKDNITILGGQNSIYEISVMPLKRGRFKGVVSFVAGEEKCEKAVDSDGEEIPDDGPHENVEGYRIWFALDVNVSAAAPEQELSIVSACQQQAVLDVTVNNPTDEVLALEVSVLGDSLTGASSMVIEPRQSAIYELFYTPSLIGSSSGSLVFFNPLVGEFWYALWLTAEPPSIVTMPHMTCEVGERIQQNINLNNPTDETLRLIPTVSNSNNFLLERDDDRPLVLRPKCSLSIPVSFQPSAVGQADHTSTITFLCEQLGEWVYHLSGTGLLPRPQPPLCVTAQANANNTFIIPFHNPLDIPVIVQVKLNHGPASVGEATDSSNEPFCLLLKDTQNIRLGPKSTLDIPISFAPREMRMSEASCLVCIQKEDHTPWVCESTNKCETSADGKPSDKLMPEIRWLYPLHGYPEVLPDKTNAVISLHCRARDRIDERIEVILRGTEPSSYRIVSRSVCRSPHPKQQHNSSPSTTEKTTENFTYAFVYGESDEVKDDVDPSVAISLLSQTVSNDHSVNLTFSIVYAPFLTMSHMVELVVRGSAGGVWRFPLQFTATEPKPDDLVTIEATGLNKVSTVGFRLTSQDRSPAPYKAYFTAGSDAEFSVSPAEGELLPVDTQGTLISISFTPVKYGKMPQGTLVIQCPDMQWTYQITGTPPGYQPPLGFSGQPIIGPHPNLKRRKHKVNYVRNNLLLNSTAVSSPIKGQPLLQSTKQKVSATGL